MHPAGERRVGRRVVEAVPYRVRDAGDGAHVRADFDQLERCAEGEVGIGHLLGADDALAGKVRGRRDVFVDHRVAPACAVFVVAHLFAEAVLEPVGRPRFALGDRIAHAALEREEAAAVGLRAREHPEVLAPAGVGVGEAFLEQFGLRQFEIEAHALQLGFELGRLFRSVIVVEHVAQAAHLEHHERKVRHQVVTAAQAELLGEVARPVRSLELHRVGEHRADVVLQRADPVLDRVGHVVEVLAHGLFVHVVEDRTGGSRCAVDHAGERIDLHQCVKYVFPFGYVDRNHLFADLVREVDRLVYAAHRVGNQLQRHDFERAQRIDVRHARIDGFEYRELRDFERGRSLDLLGVNQYDLCALLGGEVF